MIRSDECLYCDGDTDDCGFCDRGMSLDAQRAAHTQAPNREGDGDE